MNHNWVNLTPAEKQNKTKKKHKHQFPFLRTGFTKGCSTRFPSVTKQIFQGTFLRMDMLRARF